MEQGISWHTLSYSIAVNMVTSLSACLGRKIRTKNSTLVKFLGGGPHPAPGPPVEQPCFSITDSHICRDLVMENPNCVVSRS